MHDLTLKSIRILRVPLIYRRDSLRHRDRWSMASARRTSLLMAVMMVIFFQGGAAGTGDLRSVPVLASDPKASSALPGTIGHLRQPQCDSSLLFYTEDNV